MRKHFLILMLLALLPLAGWAATVDVLIDDPTTQTKVYDGGASELVVKATASGAALTGTWSPALAADAQVYTWTETVAPGQQARTVTYTITKRPLTVTLNDGVDPLDETQYTGGAIDYPTVAATGGTGTYPTGYTTTWSAAIKNAGGYSVTVQKKNGNIVNEEGVAIYTVTPAPLVVNALNQSITYGAAAPQTKDLYTAVGWLGTDENDDNIANLAVEVEFTTPLATAAGEYPFTITAGTVNNYAVTVQSANAILTINKKALTVTAKDLNAITYGDSEPTWAVNWSGLIDADKEGNAPKAGVLNGTLAYNVVRTSPDDGQSYWDAEGEVVGDVGTYSITPKVVDAQGNPLVLAGAGSNAADNYEITPVAGAFTINAKALTAASINVGAIPHKTYNGQEQTPNMTGVIKDGEKVLVLGTDFNIATTATPVKFVNDYAYTITGIGNYSGTKNATFTIDKAPLTILIKDQSKAYDGNPYTFNATWTNDCEVYGQIEGDAWITEPAADNDVFTVLPVFEYAAINESKSDVNDNYVITLKEGTGLSDNYDVIAQDATLKITAKKIYLKADNKSQVFGKAAKTLTYKLYSDEACTSALSAEIASGAVDATYMETAATLTWDGQDTFGDHPITFTANGTVKANYELAGTPKAGNYSITKAVIRIIAENKTKTYDGVAPAQSVGNVASATNLTYKVVGLIGEDQLATAPTLAISGGNGIDYKDGGYTIVASGAVVPSNNYESEISYQNGTYTINKKQLTVTAKPQGLLVGEKETDLDNSLVIFDGLIDGDEDEVTAVLQFSNKVLLNDDDEIKPLAQQTYAVEGVITNGIEVKEITGAKAGNYFTSVTTPTFASYLIAGNLLITDATELITINPVNKATWTAANEATRKSYGWQAIKDADNKKATVKFASFTMAPERWYTMVLPFKTNVAEISSKLGYAVVNVLNTSNSSDEVKFKLHMQDIEANEPFLVKVYKQIDLADLSGDADATDDPLTFAGKTIAYVETPSVEDAKGTKYIGTFMGYQTAAGITDEYYMSISDFTWHNAKDGGYTRPSGAYLKVAPGVHARILIEEPDGTTSIQTITANGEMVPAQGWYTLNGVKLQGVPTEKGIYINNGKKVVIK